MEADRRIAALTEVATASVSFTCPFIFFVAHWVSDAAYSSDSTLVLAGHYTGGKGLFQRDRYY